MADLIPVALSMIEMGDLVIIQLSQNWSTMLITEENSLLADDLL